mmetsp:Transcript_18790/g.71521  ORF Transcript_18790/g.71521 Transcript_18790/m.71521 type:complete len:237 (-) Transcript_18790:999-1709(-)
MLATQPAHPQARRLRDCRGTRGKEIAGGERKHNLKPMVKPVNHGHGDSTALSRKAVERCGVRGTPAAAVAVQNPRHDAAIHAVCPRFAEHALRAKRHQIAPLLEQVHAAPDDWQNAARDDDIQVQEHGDSVLAVSDAGSRAEAAGGACPQQPCLVPPPRPGRPPPCAARPAFFSAARSSHRSAGRLRGIQVSKGQRGGENALARARGLQRGAHVIRHANQGSANARAAGCRPCIAR